jgi:hypothetical protein
MNVFSMYLTIIILYFIVLVVYFNVLCCIGSLKLFTISCNIIAVYFYVFTIYFNVFTNIVVGIWPSHFHYNVSTMCSHLYNFLFPIHNDFLPNMLYHYPILSHSHWSILTFTKFMKILHTNFYSSHLYIIQQFTFHVATSCAEHNRAQILYGIFFNFLFFDNMSYHTI